MKVIGIAIMLLIFNISMAMVVHANIFGQDINPYFESDFSSQYGRYINQTNISARTSEQQAEVSYNIMDIFKSTLTFDWVYQYIPVSLQGYFSPIILGFNLLLMLIYIIAFIEIFVQRDILGGGG